MNTRQKNDPFRVIIPEIFREIRNLRALVNSVLTGAVTTGASAVITFAQNATLKFLDQSYLVFNDGSADQVRIGRLGDSSIGVQAGSTIVLRSSGASVFGGGVAIGALGSLSPSNFGTPQTGAIYMCNAAPTSGQGNNGDIVFRTDTTASPHIQKKISGTWTTIL